MNVEDIIGPTLLLWGLIHRQPRQKEPLEKRRCRGSTTVQATTVTVITYAISSTLWYASALLRPSRASFDLAQIMSLRGRRNHGTELRRDN